jgi:hypothetical protein
MNKRIQELFIQVSNESVNMRWNIEDAEKFAELIVQECIDKISENFVGAVGTHASAHNSAVLKCQTIIKEHFGVEE